MSERVVGEGVRAKRIRERNRRFAALSPERKRVRIARDVLKQLEDGRHRVALGVYMLLDEETGSTDLQRELEGTSCTVCALGACFVAAVTRQGGSCAFGSTAIGSREIRGALKGFFDADQLDLIEAAFEGGHFVWMRADTSSAVNFVSEVRDPAERLRRIMRNVVDNGGRFVP